MSGTLYYDTRYNSTKEVCHWIVAGIPHKAVAVHRIGEMQPGENEDEFIIIGSPIYVGKPLDSVSEFIRSKKDRWLHKPVFVFVTSWAEATVYRRECNRFLDLIISQLSPIEPVLSRSLPGKLLLEQTTQRDQNVMRRLLRRINAMSEQFHEEAAQFTDMRNQEECRQFGKDIETALMGQKGDPDHLV